MPGSPWIKILIATPIDRTQSNRLGLFNEIYPSFFSFALFAIGKSFPEAAFQAYSLKDQTISREEFTRIDEFISRAVKAENKDLVTKKDIEMLLEMGFDSLISSLNLPECLRGPDEADSDLTWGEINKSTRRLETLSNEYNVCKILEHGMPLADILRLCYRFESIDSLAREQFFDFYYLLDFLQGGKQINVIRRLKSLDEAYGTILANRFLESFAHKNEEFIMVVFSILTPSALSIDHSLLNL